MTDFNIMLFNGFETLDAFGPAEVIGRLPGSYRLICRSINGGIAESSQHIRVDTLPAAEMDEPGILLIPGGMGTRALVNDEDFIRQIRGLSEKASYVLTVCTGSALLARTNLLNGLRATSNKRAFKWAVSNGAQVNWVKRARWVKDGKFYSSSGVSAGIDMTLGFIGDIHGIEVSKAIANDIEYIWNADRDNDPFAVL